jgi:hypothetical protein
MLPVGEYQPITMDRWQSMANPEQRGPIGRTATSHPSFNSCLTVRPSRGIPITLEMEFEP